MKTLQSFLTVVLAVLLFFIAMPYLWILFLGIGILLLYLYFKTKGVMRQAQDEIHDTWNEQQYTNHDNRQHDDNVIDVEYEEKEIENE